jgi:adenylate kinase family enzyme
MKRIVVLGCAGSGKTTLARRLGDLKRAPVICLDDIWQREWTSENFPEFRRLIDAAHIGETWISDGNFAQVTFDLRLPRADLIVWLDRPRFGCMWRAIARVFRAGEAHKIHELPKVLSFIWRFDARNRPKIEASRHAWGAVVPVVRLVTRDDIESFLRGVASLP